MRSNGVPGESLTLDRLEGRVFLSAGPRRPRPITPVPVGPLRVNAGTRQPPNRSYGIVMGVFYHVEPLDDEMAALLGEMGADVPESDGTSRNPTPAEVREVCAALRDFEVEFNVKRGSFWQAVIEA
jgi:hypothetical protein